MNNQHILLDYDNYVKDYKSIYGENTIVLIQLGSFFEMCSDIDNNNDICLDIHHCQTLILPVKYKVPPPYIPI